MMDYKKLNCEDLFSLLCEITEELNSRSMDSDRYEILDDDGNGMVNITATMFETQYCLFPEIDEIYVY